MTMKSSTLITIFNGIREVPELVRFFFFFSIGMFHCCVLIHLFDKPFKLFDASFVLPVQKKP